MKSTENSAIGSNTPGFLRITRGVALVGLPVLAAGFRGGYALFPDLTWLDYGFKIFLAGTVGIWTNCIAIRMLFRPRVRTAFGRQGLIPARREELSAAVAAAVARELLDPETIRRAIEKNDMIGKGAVRALARGRLWMARPANRARLVAMVGRYCQAHGEDYLDSYLDRIMESLYRFFDEKVSGETVWPMLEKALARELRKPDNRQVATRMIVSLLDENAPALAALTDRMIQDWIRRHAGGWRQLLLLLGKGFFRLDEDYIRDELREIISRPGFFERVLDLVNENIPRLSRIGQDPEFREKITSLIEEEKGRFRVYLREKGLDLARTRILDFLESAVFWSWLDRQLEVVVKTMERYARKKITSGEFRILSDNLLEQTLKRLDIDRVVCERISSFDLERLERLVRKVSGENLCGIELFGGILGMVAGLVLISPLWAAGIAAALALFLLAERCFPVRNFSGKNK